MGPLAGIKVLELGGIGPGPFAAALLADLGADVIRIDRLAPAGGGLAMPHKFNTELSGAAGDYFHHRV